MVQVRIASIAIDPSTGQPVIILQPLGEPEDNRLLPIWIGHPEAAAILLAVQGVSTPRPMTHDLLMSALESVGFAAEQVEITRVDDGTFFSNVLLRDQKTDEVRLVDSRPSDAIAIAVRACAPIFVARSVLEEAAIPGGSVSIGVNVDDDAAIEEFRAFLERVDPADFQG
ncbi:MAG: bifunctional nuclease family protein [Coriobacteriia bacterium]|nr:bifunctional nuclease family protein [Coriobacteriia bacterium]